MQHAFFIVQPGKLEWQAVLLGCSLAQMYEDGPQGALHLTAWCPARDIDRLLPPIREFLQQAGLGPHPLPDDPFNPAYPHGNKILAAAQPRDADQAVFLDTDILMITPGPLPRTSAAAPFGAVASGGSIWARNPEGWARVFAHFGLPAPDPAQPPYFNAGLIAFAEGPHFAGKRFGDLWLQVARELDTIPGLPGTRPYLDQIALPVVLALSGLLRPAGLSRAWNFSLQGPPRNPPIDLRMVHYHGGMPGLPLHRHRLTGTCDRMVRKHSGFSSFTALRQMVATARADENWRPAYADDTPV